LRKEVLLERDKIPNELVNGEKCREDEHNRSLVEFYSERKQTNRITSQRKILTKGRFILVL
jgi:hypothetical protein